MNCDNVREAGEMFLPCAVPRCPQGALGLVPAKTERVHREMLHISELISSVKTCYAKNLLHEEK